MMFLFFPLVYFFSSIFSPVFAASIELSEPSTNTLSDQNQEFLVKVKLSIDASDGTIYYLRAVYFKEGSNNYCGYTWNGHEWFSGPISSSEGWKNFLSVTIASSSATTLLKSKLDTSDSGCKNSGIYKFKVQRYTQSGSGTFDSQNEQTLEVILSSPTMTTAPTPKIKPSATSQIHPTTTSVLTKAPAKTSLLTQPSVTSVNTIMQTTQFEESSLASISETILNKETSLSGIILAESTKTAEQQDKESGKSGITVKGENYSAIISLFTLSGVAFFASATVFGLKKWREGKTITD